jgi:hypothetical protein
MNVNVRSGLRFGVILLAVTVGSVATARAQDEARKSGDHIRARAFKASDIQRSYGFSCSGAVVASAGDALPLGPAALVGQVYCDGVDTCAGTAMASFAGLVLPAGSTGIYTVNANGTGFVTYDLTVGGQPAGQLPISFVITGDGLGIKGLPTTSGFAITCDLQAQRERD